MPPFHTKHFATNLYLDIILKLYKRLLYRTTQISKIYCYCNTFDIFNNTSTTPRSFHCRTPINLYSWVSHHIHGKHLARSWSHVLLLSLPANPSRGTSHIFYTLLLHTSPYKQREPHVHIIRLMTLNILCTSTTCIWTNYVHFLPQRKRRPNDIAYPCICIEIIIHIVLSSNITSSI